jgi:hypothetical protein
LSLTLQTIPLSYVKLLHFEIKLRLIWVSGQQTKMHTTAKIRKSKISYKYTL